MLAENNREQLKGLIEGLAAGKSGEGTIARKIGDLYNLAMDSVKLNTEGVAPIRSELEKIAGVSANGLVQLIAEMQRSGFAPYFGVYVGSDDTNSMMNIVHMYQGGLGLGDRDYYLNEDEHTKEIRGKYKEHVAKMFQLAGYGEPEACKAAADVMKIETEIAKASYEKVKLRDPHANYHKMTVEELANEIPGFDWNVYLQP